MIQVCKYCKAELMHWEQYEDHMDTHLLDGPAEERLEKAMQRPLLYVAGPMMSHGLPMINISNGIWAGDDAWHAGWTPVIPHLDVLFQVVTREQDVETYLIRDYAYIKACRAVMFLPDWEKSHGAMEEMKLVKAHNIPHFFWPEVKRPEEVL